MSREPYAGGLTPRPAREWELLQVDLVELNKSRAWEAIISRLKYLQEAAVSRGMAPTTGDIETNQAKGENIAYNRAIMVLGEVLATVRGQIARAEEE